MDAAFNKEKPCISPMGFGYFRLDIDSAGKAEDCIFMDINNEFEILTGLKKQEVMGKRVSEILGENKCPGFDWLAYCENAVLTKKTRETTQWIESAAEYYKITVIPSHDGSFAAVIQEVRKDRTPPGMKGNEPAFEGLDDIFNSTHDAMLLIEYRDGEYRYLRNNALHQKLTGFLDVRGCTPVELLGDIIGRKLTKYYDRCIAAGYSVEYEQHYDFAPGRRVWQTEITLISRHNGAVYLLSSSKDVTEFRAVQDENSVLVQRLKSMFNRHSAIMLIIEPFSGRIVDANPSACSFYGYSREEITKMYISDINMLSMEDVERNRLLTYKGQQNSFLFPHRIRSGETRIVDVYSCPISDGNNMLLYSIIFDVTDRENYRSALVKEKEVLRTTLQSIGDGVVTTDNFGNITGLNTVAQDLTGWKIDEAAGRGFSDVFLLQNEETGTVVENPVQKVLETGSSVGLANHTVLINRNGQSIPIADSAAPIKFENGHISGVVMVFRDVSSEREQNNRIRFLSYYDHLTGLLNRRYMEEIMESMDKEENLPIAVIMGDVNGLKIINDVFGHEKGDTILKYVAWSMKRNCGIRGVISRWGGDEVLIFMPHTELAAAEEVVENIKKDYLNIDKTGLHMSISFGCAVKRSMAESIRDIIREAEECMYHQKLLDGKSNRNAIINTLLAMLYEKSNETEEHSKRIESYCHMIGRALKLSSKEMDELSLLAILHDIGKVSIDPAILKKPRSLTEEEWEEMRRHAEIGYRIAQATPELAMIADLVLSHHERWDGKGYPRGLKGEEIPLPCRILAVADAFDAMTNDRVYRKGISVSEAIREIEKNAGTQFEPVVSRVFIESVIKDKRGRS